MTLFLFDIDGTLVRTGGVGRLAMGYAGGLLFGCPTMFEGLAFAGALDPLIVSRGLAGRGIPPTCRRVGRLRATYLRELRRRMPTASGEVMPGVFEAISALRARGAVGLLSGNWREGARIKLDHFDLWAPFEPVVGAFGDDALFRDELVPVAWRRAARRGIDVRRIVVIGDTAADVRCGQAARGFLAARGCDVRTVAVRTGWGTEEELRAAGPDVLVGDLEAELGEVAPLA